VFGLVASRHEDLDANLVLVDVGDHPICLEMSELNWEGFECVTFRHIVLDAVLEFLGCERTPAHTLVLVIGEGR